MYVSVGRVLFAGVRFITKNLGRVSIIPGALSVWKEVGNLLK